MDVSIKFKDIPPLTDEEIAELDALDDREIDLSDIPEITDEEWKRFYRVNPRTPEEWEQYNKYCPRAHRNSKKIAS